MARNNNNGLINNWFFCETEAGQYSAPAELNESCLWNTACVPGTVAQSMQNEKLWDNSTSVDFDNKDWWYKTEFTFNPETDTSRLNFTGLATLCEVWLNNKHILSTDNMFINYQLDVADILQENNQLCLHFRSLNLELSQRRPRPRWKTKLVEQQQLRWIRTTLLGRIPGWTPPIACVGPWQPVFIEQKNTPVNINLLTDQQGSVGKINFNCEYYCDTNKIEASLLLKYGTEEHLSDLTVTQKDSTFKLNGELQIEKIKSWWPHTHGTPTLYSATLIITANGQETRHKLNDVGFKDITLDTSNNNYQFIVNNQPIFCRGACWTTNDIVSLTGSTESLEHTLTLMRDAGCNMIRIGGTMVYEQQEFYNLCSKLGIMVWQDFMFANMDYPADDESFVKNVELEVQQVVNRLGQHVSVSAFCGNSEIEQQAAMLGLQNDQWRSPLFSDIIAKQCKKRHPAIPYIYSTPHGNVLPFHTRTQLTHYYGVGAYLRPIAELRQHDVKFTSECLGFSNIPVSKTRNAILDGQLPVSHHQKWKQGVPRDSGTGWDFEDVRDHYTATLFGIDVHKMRCFDTEQYLALSEVASGEMMSQVFSEWRSANSQCAGGLVWFLKDIVAGAGWGIIDNCGLPKACYYYLRRNWQPVNVAITNETLNGLDIHVNNETTDDFNGTLELQVLNKHSTLLASETTKLTVTKNSTVSFNSDELLKSFYDITYSYRFGPAKHSVVAVILKSSSNNTISEAFYFPNREIPFIDPTSELQANATELDTETYQLELTSNRFIYAANIDVKGYLATDNFFHLLPGTTKTIILKKTDNKLNKFKGYISAINLDEEVKIKVSSS